MLPQLVQHFFFGLRVLALVAIIMAAARPQSSTSYENMTREGIDIVLALDLSASMLSKDFEPNRLESSKEVAIQFVDERPDDRIAVVVYEGESFTQVPLTTDHVVVKNGIKQLNSNGNGRHCYAALRNCYHAKRMCWNGFYSHFHYPSCGSHRYRLCRMFGWKFGSFELRLKSAKPKF